MAYVLEPLTRASLPHGPSVCFDCVFWQARAGRPVAKPAWIERVESDWGAWGTLYRDEGGRLLGFMQYAPAAHFPRAFELPAGPPSEDAMLVTCAYLVDPSTPWVMQSLFLSAIGDARDRNIKAIEAFGYRYPEGTAAHDRFLVHRTVFPADFLADFGFAVVRAEGSVELARLELGGLVPVMDSRLSHLVRRAKDFLAPTPVPERN